MAEGKNKIIVYKDWIKKFEALKDAEAGKLIKHFFRYVNDQNPVAPDRITELAFIDIEQTLKRDLKKWERAAEKSRENGQLGGRPITKNNLEEPRLTNPVIPEPRKPDNGIGIVSDSVIDTVIFSIERCLEISLADPRWVKANKATKEELEIFNEYLEKIGKYNFVPIDYKKYFSTIKSKYSHMLKKEWSIDELKEMARKMDEENLKLKAV